MISHKISSLSGLVSEMNHLAREYCIKHRIPIIPVVSAIVPLPARAEFSWRDMTIRVSSRLLSYSKQFPSSIKVWCCFSAIRHELRHYEQYLSLIRQKIYPKWEMLDEDDAKLAGRLWADDETYNLTPELINPVSLYQSFHGVPPSRKTKVFYQEPGGELLKIGDLSEIRYQPTSPSKHTGTEFYHKSGDTGQSVLKTNLVLATDKQGRNLYLVKKDKKVKRPYFSSRGIIG